MVRQPCMVAAVATWPLVAAGRALLHVTTLDPFDNLPVAVFVPSRCGMAAGLPILAIIEFTTTGLAMWSVYVAAVVCLHPFVMAHRSCFRFCACCIGLLEVRSPQG